VVLVSSHTLHPFYVIRACGGLLFPLGGLVMTYYVWRTLQGRVREVRPMGATHVTVAAE
jgi:cytochrome c oxidase cbb3-type subunit 1